MARLLRFIYLVCFILYFYLRNTITKQRLEVDGEALTCSGSFPGGLPVPLSDLKRRKRTPPPPNNLTEGSNDSVESVFNSAGTYLIFYLILTTGI